MKCLSMYHAEYSKRVVATINIVEGIHGVSLAHCAERLCIPLVDEMNHMTYSNTFTKNIHLGAIGDGYIACPAQSLTSHPRKARVPSELIATFNITNDECKWEVERSYCHKVSKLDRLVVQHVHLLRILIRLQDTINNKMQSLALKVGTHLQTLGTGK